MKTGLSALMIAVVLAIAVGAQASKGGVRSPNADTSASQANDPIVIGRVIGRSGWIAFYDVPPAIGTDIAIRRINAAGGIGGRKVKLIDFDMKADLNLVRSGAIKLLDQGADILIVPCSLDYAAPAAIEAASRNVLSFATCAGSLNFRPDGLGPLAFTMSSPAVTQGAIMAEWAYKQGYRRAYKLEDPSIDYEQELCVGFKSRWTQLAGKKALIGEDTFQQTDKSIATQVGRINRVKNQLDFIYLCSYQPGLATAIKQIRNAGINTRILADGSLDGDYWKKAVPGLSNAYFVSYASMYGDDKVAAVNKFFKDYVKRTGKKPDSSYPAIGYATMQAIQLAIKRSSGSTDGAKLASTLEKFKGVPLLIGKTTYNKRFHIDVYREMRVLKIQNGKTSYVGIAKPKVVPVCDVKGFKC